MSWNDAELDLALRELRDEEMPGAALAEVRSRVLAEVQPRRVRWWRWAWVPALAAALAVAALIPRPPAPVEPPPLLARAPAAQPLVKLAPRQARRPAPAPLVRETQFARILTDDPDVVILWAMNTEGEAQ